MTVTARPTYFAHAEDWAQSLWAEAETYWSERTGQDINYRTRVVHPILAGLIADIVPSPTRTILDLGCGDGVLVRDEQIHAMIGHEGRYLGVDINPGLFDHADNTVSQRTASFIQLNLTDPSLHSVLLAMGAPWDIVVSVFVVQEIADIGAFFINLSRLLSPTIHAVIVTVHPAFAEWLREHERIIVEERLTGKDVPWRWAGRYPIVDEAQGTFHLPHFQRTVDDYSRFAKESGLSITRTVDIPASGSRLRSFRDEGFPPFSNYPENLYWPAIGEMPSAIAMVIGRDRNDG